MIEALFLSRPVSKRAAVAGAGSPRIAALQSSGLADVGKQVVPRARVLPVGEPLIAGDGFSKGQDDPPDFGTPFSVTSQLCAALTPRRRASAPRSTSAPAAACRRRSPLGTPGRVVATDVNERALHFTRVSAALNGLLNIETKQGVLFGPVGEERFDLITCNAPYVISPGEPLAVPRRRPHRRPALYSRRRRRRRAAGGRWLRNPERQPARCGRACA